MVTHWPDTLVDTLVDATNRKTLRCKQFVTHSERCWLAELKKQVEFHTPCNALAEVVTN